MPPRTRFNVFRDKLLRTSNCPAMPKCVRHKYHLVLQRHVLALQSPWKRGVSHTDRWLRAQRNICHRRRVEIWLRDVAEGALRLGDSQCAMMLVLTLLALRLFLRQCDIHGTCEHGKVQCKQPDAVPATSTINQQSVSV